MAESLFPIILFPCQLCVHVAFSQQNPVISAKWKSSLTENCYSSSQNIVEPAFFAREYLTSQTAFDLKAS